MKVRTGNTVPIFSPSVRRAAILILLLLLCFSGYAQNTKGDRPASSREGRFKVGQKKQKGSTSSSKRVKSKGRSYANSGARSSPRSRSRGGERAGRPIKPVFSVKDPSDRQRAWKGDISGRRVRQRDESSSTPNVHPQRGRYVKRSVPDREGRQNVTSGRPKRIPTATGRTRNVYPQRGKFVHNPSPQPRDNQRAVSNRSALARLKTMETRKPPPGRKVSVVPRSASRPFIRHKSINTYANFKRPKRKSESAVTTDLAGRRLRTKNFQSSPQKFIKAPNTYSGRRRAGDQPYRGPSGYYKSISGKGRGAWIGDITGRPVGNRSSKKAIEGTPSPFRGNRSATKTGIPGVGGGYRTATKSGRVGSAIPVRGPGRGKIPAYPGKMRLFQNQPGFNDQGEEYSGAIKARRPPKGAKSRSGIMWNNGGLPIQGRDHSRRGHNYSGNMKSRRPEKGGGSVSGTLWNNKGVPIEGSQPGNQKGMDFSGNIKGKKAGPPPGARKQSGFPGKHRLFELQPGFSDQGEEFTGYIKLSRFRRDYVQNKKAHKESILKRKPEKNAFDAEGFQVRVQRRNYVRNENSSEESLMKLKPTEATRLTGGLQVKIQRRPYVQNKNASDESLMKLRPTKVDQQMAGLQVRMKQDRYRHNPSSSDEALKVREPGKAFARVTDYQGNIKMRRFRFADRNRELHPDARFVKINRNNVSEERDSVTNLKLWWARLFKKQENQPDHLKEKGKKPRYDKGEQGMWYE